MPAVSFAGVSKYLYQHSGRMLLRDRLLHLLSRSPKERFYALKDVSFAVESGESLAIIGHNGAGESTLMNIVTQDALPARGKWSSKAASLPFSNWAPVFTRISPGRRTFI